MAKKGLDKRHRDTTGRIDKKHGNTRVKALRKTYGAHFAKGRRSDTMLKTLLAETRTESLHAYLRKHHKYANTGGDIWPAGAEQSLAESECYFL